MSSFMPPTLPLMATASFWKVVMAVLNWYEYISICSLSFTRTALGSLETKGFLTCSLCRERRYQIRALNHTIQILHKQYHDRPALLQHEHCELAHGMLDGVGGHHA